MNQNNIIKFNLEPRIAALKKENLSEREIAETLSKESNQKITKSAVHRYFSANVRLCREVVQINDKMKVKVLEAELDTIEARHELIVKIRDLGDKAENNGDLKTALYALDKAVSALDSLDKRLGQITEAPVQVTIHLNQQFNEFMEVVLQEVDDATKTRITSKLRQAVIS